MAGRVGLKPSLFLEEGLLQYYYSNQLIPILETDKDGVPLSTLGNLSQCCMALLDFFIVVSFGGEFFVYVYVSMLSVWLWSMFSLLTTTHKSLTVLSSVSALQAIVEAQDGAIGTASSWSMQRCS